MGTTKKKEATVVDVLKRMKALLRKGWTQNAFARSEKGREVKEASAKAVSFCLLGARNRALTDMGYQNQTNRDADSKLSMEVRVRKLLSECVGHGAITTYNDNGDRTKKEILDVVSCAIKKASARDSQGTA